MCSEMVRNQVRNLRLLRADRDAICAPMVEFKIWVQSSSEQTGMPYVPQ